MVTDAPDRAPRRWESIPPALWVIALAALAPFPISAAIYGYELVLGIQIWRDPSSKGALINLLLVLMGAYAVGLGRAWELLGAPRTGVITGILERLARRLDRPPKPKS